MTTRWAVGGLLHESNSFSSLPTSKDSFQKESEFGEFLFGDDVRKVYGYNNCLAGFVEVASAAKIDVKPLLYSEAKPSAPIEQTTFDWILDLLRSQLHSAGPVDLVYLDLHGAMLSAIEDNADALIIETVRQIVGQTPPIVATIDFHANITNRLLSAANLVLPYKTYPHIDMRDRGRELSQICLNGDLEQCNHRYMRHLPFMFPVNHQYTFDGPTLQLLNLAEKLENAHDDLFKLNLTAGFQPSDIPSPLPSIFGYGRDASVVRAAVNQLYEKALSLEADYAFSYTPYTELTSALNSLGKPTYPVIIADAQDNAGGGGSSDTMFISHALYNTGYKTLVGNICDPTAARELQNWEIGRVQEISIGGTTVTGDKPLTAKFELVAKSSSKVTPTGPMLAGQMVDIGQAALVRTANLSLVVMEARHQCLDQGFFLHFGADPKDFDVVVVKSAVHFRSDFDKLSPIRIDAIAPGYEAMDFSALKYTKLEDGVRFFGLGPSNGQPS